jgi:hypothetical protein
MEQAQANDMTYRNARESFALRREHRDSKLMIRRGKNILIVTRYSSGCDGDPYRIRSPSLLMLGNKSAKLLGEILSSLSLDGRNCIFHEYVLGYVLGLLLPLLLLLFRSPLPVSLATPFAVKVVVSIFMSVTVL